MDANGTFHRLHLYSMSISISMPYALPFTMMVIMIIMYLNEDPEIREDSNFDSGDDGNGPLRQSQT